jgi:hypothetical protein
LKNQGNGFLNIDVAEDGTRIAGTFYGISEGKIMDKFTIKKNLSTD